jgi:hypothetical protein
LIQSNEFRVCIYSSRSAKTEGRLAMKDWFMKQGMPAELVYAMDFVKEKPAAFLTVDDRCICFQGPGTYPTFDTLLNFKPWNK